MSYFPTDIPFMSDEELIENGLKKPYRKPEIIKGTDLVPVVRCGQCKYWQGNDSDYDYGYCYAKDGHGFGHAWGKNDFCSYGERREEHEKEM